MIVAPPPNPVIAVVDRYLSGQMKALKIPGMQLAVVQSVHIVLLGNYGTASIELGVPVNSGTVLAINSGTTAFTEVAAMRLVEAGKLDLSWPIPNYLDGLPQTWPSITIHQLISHMSGFP